MTFLTEKWPFKRQGEYLIDLEDLIWIAGLFEGEGCISIHTASQTTRLYTYMQLRSTDRDVIEHVAGILELNILGPYPQLGKGYKDHWAIQITGMQAVADFCYNIWPYVFDRRRQQIFNGMENIKDRIDL